MGGAVALYHAERMIHEQRFPCVLVAAADSYLTTTTLRLYEEQGQILAEDNSDGFIPGEAGGALLVGPPAPDGGPVVLGLGFALKSAPGTLAGRFGPRG